MREEEDEESEDRAHMIVNPKHARHMERPLQTVSQKCVTVSAYAPHHSTASSSFSSSSTASSSSSSS